jgi:hypothetical protein
MVALIFSPTVKRGAMIGSMFLAGCVALDMAQTAVTSEALRRDSTAPVPLELPFGYSADVILPPIQKSDTGALLAAYPNPDGLEAASAMLAEEAVHLLAELWSGDALAMQRATDPAMARHPLSQRQGASRILIGRDDLPGTM